MLPLKFDHFVLHVSNWRVSNEFYERILGAQIVPRGVGYAYRFDGFQLNIHGPGLSPHPVARIPVMPGNSDLCFEWNGTIESAISHLQQNGVEIELGPVERNGTHGRGQSLYFRDPDGSLLEFIVYPTPQDF